LEKYLTRRRRKAQRAPIREKLNKKFSAYATGNFACGKPVNYLWSLCKLFA